MARTRTSAKKAGTAFERLVADYLANALDDRIDRRVKTGATDKGDIANVRDSHGRKIVIECKNTTRLDLAAWIREAQQEAINDQAHVGLIVHKRHGKAAPEEQWVTMTLTDLVALLAEPGATHG
ncbi:hypothetical protein [Corynebacterium renale]|uniref:hypothetical protein n=1 Tax=Corynebacterium renale TaxID=1724 RepID=UPI000DFC6BA4|nr:hypothetical protein [Corynebacterium renale]STC97635.1 Uncharacterised protein [Corynebacterium renale]